MRTALRLRYSTVGAAVVALALLAPASPAAAVAGGAVKKLSPRAIQRLPGWKAYKKLCATCHGKKGDGKGIFADTVQPPPANYTNCSIVGAVSDEDMQKVILGGGLAIGKSDGMQGFKDKIDSSETVGQLIDVVRAFGGCAFEPQAGK